MKHKILNSGKSSNRSIKPIGLLAHKLISLFFILCLVLSCCCPVHARSVGTSGSSALRIGVGARATGMGEATVALADDVSSIYWNPAGLYQVRSSQLSAMYVEWLADIRYGWLACAQPLASWGTLAADVLYADVGSIPRTIESPTEGYEPDGTFTVADMAGRVALGGKVLKNLLAGASLQVLRSKVGFENVINERISDKTAQATAVSFGCLYNTPVPRLSVGCSFQNLGRQTKAFIKERAPMPFVLKLGVAYKMLSIPSKTEQPESGQPSTAVSVNSEKSPNSPTDVQQPASLESQVSSLILAMDLNFTIDNSVSARMGAEYRFGNGIAIRGGYRTSTGFDFPSGLCVGAGYSTSSYQLDYALIPYGDIGNTHRVSFTVKF